MKYKNLELEKKESTDLKQTVIIIYLIYCINQGVDWRTRPNKTKTVWERGERNLPE